MPAEQVDDPAQIHLELLYFSAHRRSLLMHPLAEPNNNTRAGLGSVAADGCRTLMWQLFSAFFRHAWDPRSRNRWQSGEDTPRPDGL
ncbi:hypothetical protein GCM10010489_31530 [Microbacterium saperdae]|nr:hypothetical protein GCM10010489_31530 [Microbacterium saperdae]